MTTSLPADGAETPIPSTVGSAPDAPKKRGIRVRPKVVVGFLILVAVVWFALANTRNAQIKLWVHNVQAPVWLVLLATFVAGILVGLLLGRRRRHKS